jgi:hypothetical protein
MPFAAISQNIGIGTHSPTASAVLEVSSPDKGILIPRMGLAEMNAIASPAEGLMVYCTTDSALYSFKTAWTKISYRNNDSPSFNTGFYATNKFSQFVIGGSGGPSEPFKKVCFDSVYFNSGSYYSKADSQYMAPAAGIYHFDIKITSSESSVNPNAMIVQLRVNNTEIRAAATGPQTVSFPSGVKYYNADININLKLEQGDIVNVWARPLSGPLFVNASANPCINYFTGYRVY